MLEKEVKLEIKFTLIKKEETANDHGDKLLLLHFRADMPGRQLFLEPLQVGHHALHKLDETWLRTLLIDAMPWRTSNGRP